MTTNVVYLDESAAAGWERTLYAFLAEKERRSGSFRMAPDASLWPDTRNGRGITSGTFYTNLRRYLKQACLPPGGVHIFRHSAAKLRRVAGESVEEVTQFLAHSTLAVMTTYLRRLEGQEDKSWEKVAAAIGI